MTTPDPRLDDLEQRAREWMLTDGWLPEDIGTTPWDVSLKRYVAFARSLSHPPAGQVVEAGIELAGRAKGEHYYIEGRHMNCDLCNAIAAWDATLASTSVVGDEPIPMPERQTGPVELAKQFHEAYERLAKLYGYTTREETRTFDPESKNGHLMIAVCAELAENLERQPHGERMSDEEIERIATEHWEQKVKIMEEQGDDADGDPKVERAFRGAMIASSVAVLRYARDRGYLLPPPPLSEEVRNRVIERIECVIKTARQHADNPVRNEQEVDHALCVEVLSYAQEALTALRSGATSTALSEATLQRILPLLDKNIAGDPETRIREEFELQLGDASEDRGQGASGLPSVGSREDARNQALQPPIAPPHKPAKS